MAEKGGEQVETNLTGWLPFDGGKSIGQAGTEQGAIILDEEYEHSARITLEHNTRIAPFAITCGMYGWFFHTRFFSSEKEAQRAYAEMKVELARMVGMLSPQDSDKDRARSAVINAISDFVERFP